MKAHSRILFCKGGMDGHTRPIRLLAREFRDAGFEVVLTDMYQSPEEICTQALQEDPHIIAVSIHTRGHNRLFGMISLILKQKGIFDDFGIAAGGVITEEDHAGLKEMGVRLISSPGESIQGSIIPRLKELAMSVKKNTRDPNVLYSALREGDTGALARFITLLVSRDSDAQKFAKSRIGGKSFSVGFSGSGGVGKSSLLGKLIELLRPEHKLGVLCVDPAAVSGGAVLADRIRFQTYEITTDPNVYVRSIASRKAWKGVTRETPAIIRAMRHARRDIVLVESVGSGQMDVGFNKVVDTFVYVASPDMGDEMQMLKGGAIETADIIVLNKSDKSGATRTEAALISNFGRKARKDGWIIPVIKAVASDEKDKLLGIGELWAAVEAHQEFLKGSPTSKASADRRRRNA